MPRSTDPVSEKMRVAKLFSIYGPLLSERQKKFIDLHCNEDLSLSEIAEDEGISRQAVFDAIKQGKKRLARFESVLHLCEPTGPVPAEGSEAPQAPAAAGTSVTTPRPETSSQIAGILDEIESLCESGVVYDTRKLRQHVEEIRQLVTGL